MGQVLTPHALEPEELSEIVSTPLINCPRPRKISQSDPDKLHEVCSTDFAHILAEFVLSNNAEELGKSLETLQPETKEFWLNHLHHRLRKPLLLLACSGKNGFEDVNPEIIEILIDNGARIDYFDVSWYCWEPLHYAAQSCHPPRLKALVSRIEGKINSLTSMSENALHILLTHGRDVETYQISCRNGLKQKMTKIVRAQQQELLDCVEILINAGIDVNHSNFWNETPIILAINAKQFQVVKLLLKAKDIDLDSCKEPIFKKSARDLLKSYKIDLDLLPKHHITKNPSKILFQFLKSGDEDSFLKFANGKISPEIANSIDGDSEENSSCTLLQYCFRRAFIKCKLESSSDEVSSWQSDVLTCDLVKNFCQDGMVRVIEHLLNNGADINFVLRKFNEPLIKAASNKKFYPFLAMILYNKSVRFSTVDICESIHELVHNHREIDNTLLILLTKLDDIRDARSSGFQSPLSPPEKNLLKESLAQGVKKMSNENIRLLFKISGSISTKRDERAILEEVPAEVIESHLDDCIEKKNDSVCINYDSLVEEGDEAMTLRIFHSIVSLNPFLNHLIIKVLIKRKWQKLRFIFNATLSFYILFYVLINMFVLFKYSKTSGTTVDFTKTLAIVCLLIFTVKELFQLVRNFRIYVSEFSNCAEVIFIILAAVTFFAEKYYVDVVMVYLVLSANLVLLLLLEQVPVLTKYMIILRTVVFYLQYIIFYFILFLAFAICFYVLFSNPDRLVWHEVPVKLFETIIMFTGSLDYMETENFNNYEVSSRIVFMIFVLAMAVILHNLLLGLLVTDMTDIKKDLKLYEQKRRARFIVRVEDFLKKDVVKVWFDGSNLFGVKKYFVLEREDLEQLDENQKEHLENVLARKAKAQNVLRKLYHYIRSNNKRGEEREPAEINKEILEKIKVLEERIRDLHDLKEIIKAEFTKNKS